jgi:hypothetical protein
MKLSVTKIRGNFKAKDKVSDFVTSYGTVYPDFVSKLLCNAVSILLWDKFPSVSEILRNCIDTVEILCTRISTHLYEFKCTVMMVHTFFWWGWDVAMCIMTPQTTSLRINEGLSNKRMVNAVNKELHTLIIEIKWSSLCISKQPLRRIEEVEMKLTTFCTSELHAS